MTTPNRPARPAAHPRPGVFNHRRPSRFHLQSVSGLQEERRIRFGRQLQVAGGHAVDQHLEGVPQPGRIEDHALVLAGRHGGERHTGAAEGIDQLDGAVMGLHAVGLDLGPEVAVLAVAEPADRLGVRRVGSLAPGQLDAPRRQEPRNAVVTGEPVDVGQVVLVAEGRLVAATLGQEGVEEPLPRGPVPPRRCG